MKLKAVLGIMVTLLLLSILTLTLNIQSVKAESLPLISLNPMECTVAPGETFTVNINITNVPPLQGYEFKLWFNNTIINVTGADSYGRDLEGNIIPNPLRPISACAPGKLIDGTYYWTPLQNVSDGFIWVAVLFPIGRPFTGSGILVTINFTALTLGVSTLHLYDTILCDPLAQPIAHAALDGSVTVVPGYILTIYSLPTGVTFTVDGVSRATPWSETYYEGASVSLMMPPTHTVGNAKYYWNQWSDGVTTQSRTVTMNTNITLTAKYTGPYYQLTVTSSPITGIAFTINGNPKTTPYTEWLLGGSYTLIMPQTHKGYIWSHWLEDGDPNRIKTILLQGTTWTAVYEPAPKPVGGKATPINVPMNKPETPTLWIWLSTIILSLVLAGVYVKKRKRNTRTLPYVKC